MKSRIFREAPLKLVIPAHAGIQEKAAGFRVKPGMTDLVIEGNNVHTDFRMKND
jgi:hypothetical protein